MSDHNEVKAISDNFQTVSLMGFTFIADRLPNDCGVCLIVETGGHLSAACWNPEYHLIGSTEYGFTVYAKDADPCLIVEYTGGDGGVILFHIDVKTRNCFATNKDDREEIPYIKGGLKDWYEDNKERLIEDYHSGRYSVLPEWE